jgi:hypothetical protein
MICRQPAEAKVRLKLPVAKTGSQVLSLSASFEMGDLETEFLSGKVSFRSLK